ncbi:GNAT family N-acetyltransferase [Paenibacillus wynnii]|uniref:GNAT family N-acetyltransferase n=1 Tax=Paenibacillus wynnii TaxID=268407 RepID=UPI00279376AA|nr:GNAT family N-acetyltransferase [Paenibacillus wynnii]MDQ0196466.1 RimJ/RimL family protein N-acetyltransferase [Paenibacillus wynnii]
MTNPIDPILISFPESFETERLLIRAPLWGDGVSLNEAIGESLNEVKPWMLFAQTMPTLEESEIFTREARLAFLKRDKLHMRIFNKSTGSFIGNSGLHQINWDTRNFEIGYWIRSSCSGYGYMTEAVNGITEFAIHTLEANRIEIRCSARNFKSAAVAERAGFTLDGILRSNCRGMDGELHDSKVYAKVRGVEF